jgi:hypothetical protein
LVLEWLAATRCNTLGELLVGGGGEVAATVLAALRYVTGETCVVRQLGFISERRRRRRAGGDSVRRVRSLLFLSALTCGESELSACYSTPLHSQAGRGWCRSVDGGGGLLVCDELVWASRGHHLLPPYLYPYQHGDDGADRRQCAATACGRRIIRCPPAPVYTTTTSTLFIPRSMASLCE